MGLDIASALGIEACDPGGLLQNRLSDLQQDLNVGAQTWEPETRRKAGGKRLLAMQPFQYCSTVFRFPKDPTVLKLLQGREKKKRC